MTILFAFLALILGYLLGSINPAYFLGKCLKGIDIRAHGTKNAGTINSSKVLGKGPTIIVLLFDISKGVISMGIAYAFGLPPIFIYLSGCMAIIGHIFPFYLEFRGGQGAATAAGMLIYFLSILFFVEHRIPILVLPLLAVYTLIIWYIVRKSDLLSLLTVPFILFWVIYYNYNCLDLLTIFTCLILLFIIGLNIMALVTKKDILGIKPEVKKKMSHWRVFLRPLAAIFPILYFYIDKKIILIFIGILAIISIGLDISRLSSRKFNKVLYESTVEIFREKEHKKFSSMSIFFVAASLTILLFPKNIAILAIFFLIFGDMAAKFFGLQFGRTKIFNKSLEGSLAYFLTCLLLGVLLSNFMNISLVLIVLGAFSAALAEVLPFGIDDNFTVPIISAAVMWLVTLF